MRDAAKQLDVMSHVIRKLIKAAADGFGRFVLDNHHGHHPRLLEPGAKEPNPLDPVIDELDIARNRADRTLRQRPQSASQNQRCRHHEGCW
jgi:hypothetical protein